MLPLSSPMRLLAIAAAQLLIHLATAHPGSLLANETKRETLHVHHSSSHTALIHSATAFPGKLLANQTKMETVRVHRFSTNTTLIHQTTALPKKTLATHTKGKSVYTLSSHSNTTQVHSTTALPERISVKNTQRETTCTHPFSSNTTQFHSATTLPENLLANHTSKAIPLVHTFSSNANLVHSPTALPGRILANQTKVQTIRVHPFPSNTTFVQSATAIPKKIQARQQPEGEIVCVQPFPSDAATATDLTNFVLDYSSQICSMLGQGQQGTLAREIKGYAFYGASMVTRDPNTCTDAFKQIANACISQGSFYGGEIVEGGQLYNLTNVVFPSNPLSDVTFPSVPPLGPLPPMPSDCPPVFSNDTTTTATATAGQAKFTQHFSQATDTEMFTPQTQWRFFTDAQTDVYAWEVDFTGGVAPQVTASPTVVSFEMQEGVLPSEQMSSFVILEDG
jgi:hypothetical protein